MNGKPDILKGSYYANPTLDHKNVHEDTLNVHSTYLRSNIWPTEVDCPGFEKAYKALASFMTEIGKRLAKACDHLVASHSNTVSIEKLITTSHCSKARLLHYFPPSDHLVSIASESQEMGEGESGEDGQDTWCGEHVDHSLLTALCPGMYLFHPVQTHSSKRLQPLIVPPPTSSAGLYIRTRAGQTIKASIPSDCMAFQTGEALQLLTQNRLRATPHYVAACGTGPTLDSTLHVIRKKVQADESWKNVTEGAVSRETMAVFLQPDISAVIGEDGESFGAFTERIVGSHY